jgi:hypothetical protein
MTIKYTNQAGVPNQVSHAVLSNPAAGTITPFSLAAGDTGCLSVESFTMGAASTVAGNMGITLLKKIATMPPETGSYVERQGYRNLAYHGGIAEIKPGAYLQLVFMPSTSLTGATSLHGRLGIVEV